MKFKKIAASGAALASVLVFASTAFAHVVVSPKEVGVGKFQSFSVGVPVEKDIPTVGVRLLLPEGLNYVTPNVKPGWTITVKKEPVMKDGKQVMSEDGDEKVERASEIIWAGGSVPAGQRDDFLFSAQVPAATTTITWKAYQTYADGSVVAWDASSQAVADQKKNTDEQVKNDANYKLAESAVLHPYSETKVIDDLSAPTMQPASSADQKSAARNAKVALVVSVVGLIVAVFAISRKS